MMVIRGNGGTHSYATHDKTRFYTADDTFLPACSRALYHYRHLDDLTLAVGHPLSIWSQNRRLTLPEVQPAISTH